MESQARKKQAGQERTDHAHYEVSNETESSAANDLTRKPAGHYTNNQNYEQTLTR